MKNNSSNENKSELDLYTKQGLNSPLTKEKLVTVISNLQNMPVELAMKLSEHIPEYFRICKEALDQYVSTHKSMIESDEKYAQGVFDALSTRRQLLKKGFDESKTPEEKKFYIDELKKVDKEEEEIREKIKKEHEDKAKSFIKGLLPIVALAGGVMGVSVGLGKHRRR